MSIRTVLIVLLAAVFGLSATLAVRHFANQGQARERPVIEAVEVVVVTQEIPKYKSITKDMVKLVAWPKNMVPEGACTKLEDVLERGTLSVLLKNEVVLNKRLLAKGVSPGLAGTIPVGMRAYTIMTPNAASGVAGFILPGNKVDVLLTVSGGESTRTLLAGIEILAVNQAIDAPSDHKINVKDMVSVTLLVSPKQAALLDLGQAKGKLHLSLRNPLDTDESATTKVDWTSLGSAKEPPKSVDPPDVKPEVVEVKPKEVTPTEDPKRGPLHTLRIVQGESVTIAEYDLEAPPGTAAKVTPLKTPAGKEKK